MYKHFYPRPPRGGRRVTAKRSRRPWKFLSTPSARRATWRLIVEATKGKNFYPRPPRGGRPIARNAATEANQFLSTPSARRATRGQFSGILFLLLFLSTPSARRATRPSAALCCRQANFYPRPPRGGRLAPSRMPMRFVMISIHALREEGDGCACAASARGGLFLSTPSARRATRAVSSKHSSRWHFYPRPPRGGRRAGESKKAASGRNFYPRPPRGGRL